MYPDAVVPTLNTSVTKIYAGYYFSLVIDNIIKAEASRSVCYQATCTPLQISCHSETHSFNLIAE